ncbi:MAG: NAD-dependent epimerase/dehydratase family protein [Candidatus Omnitrophica bacterium]|nr:NAD-dependent epimerase/dehydratase family protein [Candidatus Omnitrophota bacterium]
MRILVTGGAGLVGSHCAEYFAKKKCQVFVLDNLMRSELFKSKKKSVEYNWNYLESFKNIKRIKGDVRNEKDVLKAIGSGVDAVIHTAGQPGVPSSVRMPRDDFSINAFGTLNVLECLRKKSPKAAFVYCSTNKVYGENVDKVALRKLKTRYVFKGISGIDETTLTDLTGHTPYGVSKLAGDLYTQEYAHIYAMRTAVFRMSCIYGERQFGFEDQGWVAWFIIAALLGREITVYGDGRQVRDLLYAKDLVNAFDRFITGKQQHILVNIGGGNDNTVSLLEFLSKLENITGRKPIVEFSNWRPSDQKVYIRNIGKVKKFLSWKPETGVDEGLEQLANWIKANKDIF